MMGMIRNGKVWISIIVWISLLAPFCFWTYKALVSDLGAEPVVKLNKNFGNIVLILFVVNLWIGQLMRLRFLSGQGMALLVGQRRKLGIVTGIYLIFHFVTYFGKEAFEWKAVEQIYTKFYLLMGMIAAIGVWILMATSNDLSMRLLGGVKWKKLHKTVHWIFVILLFHIFLIEKADLLYFAILTLPLILLKGARFLNQDAMRKSR